MPHGNESGSERNRPCQRKAVPASSFPDSIRVLARFGETDARSRLEAAIPSDSHAVAANIAAVGIQSRRSARHPKSRNRRAAKIITRGGKWAQFFSSIERSIPPAKHATGKREGSFMCAV
jgi:hypothetical protein